MESGDGRVVSYTEEETSSLALISGNPSFGKLKDG